MNVQSFHKGRAVLHGGDCLDVLAGFEPAAFDAVVTDPPYELGFMGRAWDKSGIAFRPETWAAIGRVLKPGGHLVAFGAPKNFHRMVCAIEDAGFEVRDSIRFDWSESDAWARFIESLSKCQAQMLARLVDNMGCELHWNFGSGFPKSYDISQGIEKIFQTGRARRPDRDLGLSRNRFSGSGSGSLIADTGGKVPITAEDARRWQGWGTALKPAYEPICLARWPLSEKTVAANVLRHGVGALNIDACRVPSDGDVRPRGSSWLDTNMHEGWARPYMQNRELMAEREAAAIERANTLGRWPANVCHDGSAEVVEAFPKTAPAKSRRPRSRTKGTGWRMTSTGAEYDDAGGSAARFFYSAKADADDRIGSKHPTVKPVDLMQWLVRMVCPPGGTILDPFAGTGTTGAAALREGMRVELIEREAEYRADIGRRMAHVFDGEVGRKAARMKARLPADADHGPLFVSEAAP